MAVRWVQSSTTANLDCGTTAAWAVRLIVASIARPTANAALQRQGRFVAGAVRRNESTSAATESTILLIHTAPLYPRKMSAAV